MKLDIPYYIRQVLREKRMVSIPGIGTFKLVQSSAVFNEDKTTISPPILNVKFDEVETDDQSLLKYILDTGLMSEEKAKKKIEQFTQSAFNKLLNLDSFVITGLGAISKSSSGDSAIFKPNMPEFTREFYGLKPISLTPISRINKHNPIHSISAATSQSKGSGSFIPRIIILSLLLIALYFLGRHLYKTYLNDPDQKEIGIKDDIKDDIEDDGGLVYDEAKQDELEQKYEEIDELIDPGSEKNIQEQENNIKLKEELDNLSNRENKDSGTENIGEGMGGSNPDDEGTEKADKTDADSVASNSNGTTKSDIVEKSMNKHADIIPESGKCIIIVGSFIKSLNTIKMVSLLERKGYTVHQSEYKGFDRVGLVYECDDEDLEGYLQDIRKKISSKAWYLDPELEVPYLK